MNDNGNDMLAYQEAAQTLRDGGLVAFPTETVYGLGADARSTEAVERIFRAKGRPSDNPLIVHIADRAQLSALAESISPLAEALMDRFWPGPLTLVLPAREGAVSPRVTAGLRTVAVRMPGHPAALRLIAAAGCPVAAPSANRSGRPSPTQAVHVLDDLGGSIDGILDGGPAGVGLESTVVEPLEGRIHVLRPGGITAEQLREVAEVVLHASLVSGDEQQPEAEPAYEGEAPAGSGTISTPPGAAIQPPLPASEGPKSPGMKYRHYAPRGQMMVAEPRAGHDAGAFTAAVQAALDTAKARGETTGILTYEEHASLYHADIVAVCGRLAEPETIAQGLYGALRRFDAEGATYILAETIPAKGIGFAVMNRLSKAAGHRKLEWS
ncbi:translation factor [Paenibacillus swuensis]|uniref:Threonylcarbamoyl-AMP synthase n=1 Tax=Paenibacillus swuensis TaxID=1178515 RepID=A0A172TPL7_9BACL|nr:translation factor [Paenibacillus swuensis]